MKIYDVLEAHQGDRSYQPGDRRIADPNTVAHLVTLGVLSELGDAPTEPLARDPLTDATAQIVALTGERDDARAELSTFRDLHRGSTDDLALTRQGLTDAQANLAAAHVETEQARTAQNAAEQHAAELAGKVAALTEDLAAARKLVKPAKAAN